MVSGSSAFAELDTKAIAACNIHWEGKEAPSEQVEHRMRILQSTGLIEQLKGAKILELGCGQGDMTSVLAAVVGEKGHVTAVDPAPLTYGSPWTLGQAQDFLSKGPLGSRITWVEADPVDFLSKEGESGFDYVVLCHSLYYFGSPDVVKRTLKAIAAKCKTLIVAEYSLKATKASAQAHVLAVLAEALLECHKPTSESNVRTVLSPAGVKKLASAVGFQPDHEAYVVPGPELQDGRWELSTVLDPAYRQQISDLVPGSREQMALGVMVDACEAAVALQGGAPACTTMDVWVSVLRCD